MEAKMKIDLVNLQKKALKSHAEFADKFSLLTHYVQSKSTNYEKT